MGMLLQIVYTVGWHQQVYTGWHQRGKGSQWNDYC